MVLKKWDCPGGEQVTVINTETFGYEVTVWDGHDLHITPSNNWERARKLGRRLAAGFIKDNVESKRMCGN